MPLLLQHLAPSRRRTSLLHNEAAWAIHVSEYLQFIPRGVSLGCRPLQFASVCARAPMLAHCATADGRSCSGCDPENVMSQNSKDRDLAPAPPPSPTKGRLAML